MIAKRAAAIVALIVVIFVIAIGITRANPPAFQRGENNPRLCNPNRTTGPGSPAPETAFTNPGFTGQNPFLTFASNPARQPSFERQEEDRPAAPAKFDPNGAEFFPENPDRPVVNFVPFVLEA